VNRVVTEPNILLTATSTEVREVVAAGERQVTEEEEVQLVVEQKAPSNLTDGVVLILPKLMPDTVKPVPPAGMTFTETP